MMIMLRQTIATMIELSILLTFSGTLGIVITIAQWWINSLRIAQ
jgi:hypothetical protein